jgi:hypothetical protein
VHPAAANTENSMFPSPSARSIIASLALAAAPSAFADEAVASSTESSTAPPPTTMPALAPPATPPTPVAARVSSPKLEPSVAPEWQLGIALPALFATNAIFGSVGVERRVTDNVWLMLDVNGAVQHTDDPQLADGNTSVADAVFAGGSVGARWYLVDDGRIRPSLRADAGIDASSSVAKVGGVDDHPQETIWSANAAAGVDVDVFLVDNVAFRLGTSLLDARVQWGQDTIATVTSAIPTIAWARLQMQSSAALQVFF